MTLRSLIAGRTLGAALVLTTLPALVQACGEEEQPPAGTHSAGGTTNDQGGEAGTSANGGSSARGGSAGRASGGSAGATSTGGTAGASTDGGGPADGGEPASGGSSGSGVGGGGSGGSSGSGGQAGAPTEPSLDCPPEPTSGDPPSATPLCDIDATWGAGERVSVPTTGSDVLLSVTPDELTIAWAAVDVFTSAVFVADRASVDDDFDAPVEQTEPMLAAAGQIGLSPDGLRLAAAVSGRLLEATRAARGDAFDPPEEGSFSLLNADADSSGTSLQDPVISADDSTLYYSLLGDGEDTLRVSSRSGSQPWPVGRTLGECEFKAHSGSGRAPLAISSDGLTLFYFDNPRGITRAAFRPALDWPFLDFVDLTDHNLARPNAACDRLYYSGMGVFPVELLVAERQ